MLEGFFFGLDMSCNAGNTVPLLLLRGQFVYGFSLCCIQLRLSSVGYSVKTYAVVLRTTLVIVLKG